MVGVQPRCVPIGWNENQHGRKGKTAHLCYIREVTRKGPRMFDSRVCPVTYEPDASKIGRARRNYLAWWAALLDVRSRLIAYGNLDHWALSDVMPPRTPWKKPVD